MLTLHEHEADYRQSTLRHDIAQVRFIVATTTLAILLANLGDLWLAGFDADALSRLWLFGWQGTLTLMVLLILPNITRWAVFDWVFLGWTLSYFLIALYFRAIAVPVVNAATIALLAFGTYTLFPHRIEFRAVPALVLTAGDLWILGALHGAGRADLVATGLAYLFLHLTGGWVATARETDRRRRYLAQLAQDEASRELERLANLDALTGTLSRRRWLELAEAEFGRFRRHRRPFAVLLVDLDFSNRSTTGMVIRWGIWCCDGSPSCCSGNAGGSIWWGAWAVRSSAFCCRRPSCPGPPRSPSASWPTAGR